MPAWRSMVAWRLFMRRLPCSFVIVSLVAMGLRSSFASAPRVGSCGVSFSNRFVASIRLNDSTSLLLNQDAFKIFFRFVDRIDAAYSVF